MPLVHRNFGRTLTKFQRFLNDFFRCFFYKVNKHDTRIKEPYLRCHLLLPKSRVASLSCTWRPKPGHWCSQGWNFWAVAETCGHYLRKMLLAVASQLTQEWISSTKMMGCWGPCITSKLCLHSNLQTLRSVGTSADAACCVSIAAHKRRPRNRPCLSKGCAEVLW